MGWFAAGLIVPILATYALVAFCDRDARNDAATVFLRLCLAIGIGLGLSSCTYFFWLFFVGSPARSYRVCELTVFSAAGLLALMFGRGRATCSDRPPLTSTAMTGWNRLLAISFVAALILAALGAIGAYVRDPLGDWDAWAIWNQRARFLYCAGDGWREAFSPVFQHTDYPLLLPCSNVRLWSYLGMEQSWVPWFLGVCLTFATVGLLTAGVCRLRSRSQGLLAGLTLLGMVPFLQQGTWQYADIPLAFFILSAVLLLVLYDASERPHWGMLALSGLTAGLAAWTKNDGLLLLIALPVARSVAVWHRDGVPKVFSQFLYWSIGVLPVLAAIVLHKAFLAGDNDLLSGQNWDASLPRLLDPWRYWYVVQALVLYALRIARPFAIVLPLCVLFLGMTRSRPRGARGLPTACVTLVLMLAGYSAVYILTPWDIHWHLASSAERLLLQLLPLALLIVFLSLASPEELLARESIARNPCEPPLR